MGDREACAELYRDLCAASVAKDEAGMASVLADGYVLVHMTGMRQSKRAYVDAVLDGTLSYYAAEHESIDVEVAPDGEHTFVYGCSRMGAAVFTCRPWRCRPKTSLPHGRGGVRRR